ncbi:translation initiation factor IF-3 [Simkania negevensis]|uniref:Translation initiation factor IF-3 n=1 Tax=Simkania negevensis TaxID=83561 RepID=A0ABS3APK5_9BACT|nr:translation initiation factor IF-3 [Simkania negevensis]
MKINEQIRAPKVRVIDQDGKQVGVITIREALDLAKEVSLDLVEIAPAVSPPVCKIINYGKFRYDQTKRLKESKKGQVQIKVKEIKLKPNIDPHDLQIKIKHARQFVEKGNKVKFTCILRGRDSIRPERAHQLLEEVCSAVEDIGTIESMPKRLGRMFTVIVAPGTKKK